MKRLVFILALLMVSEGIAQGIDQTNYYFIRHAEKDRSDPNDRDPALTSVGQSRASYWKEVLSKVSFDLVYSTDYKRTRQTALPTAQANGKELLIYDPKKMYSEEFQKKTLGKTVLVVGHSNTTPAFVNMVLGESRYEAIDDKNNGNLYIVTGKPGAFSSVLLTIDPR
jgi:broad specificity phosphatase PhoE